MTVNISQLIDRNRTRWDQMVLDPTRVPAFDAIAKRLSLPENKSKYQAVAARLQTAGYQAVPWWMIAVVSEREYGGPPHWDKQLGQGDPLHERSVHDPAGRGPFIDHEGDDLLNNAWLRCALDALIDCAPHAAHWPDWSPGGVATIIEEYNGPGYAMRGVPSAYVWSGSNQYVSGKYVADHVYRAGVRDVQEGCMPIVRRMMLLDKTIAFPGANQIIAPIAPPLKPASPTARRGLVEEFLAEAAIAAKAIVGA